MLGEPSRIRNRISHMPSRILWNRKDGMIRNRRILGGTDNLIVILGHDVRYYFLNRYLLRFTIDFSTPYKPRIKTCDRSSDLYLCVARSDQYGGA